MGCVRAGPVAETADEGDAITALCLPLQPFLEEELGFLGGHLHRQYTLKQTPHIRSFSVMEIPCDILIALFNFQVQENTP